MSLAMPMVAVGSPTRQSFGPPFPGFRANSLSSSPNLNKSGGIRKRSSTTTANTLSTVCPERLYQAALDIADFKESSAIPAAAGFQWITPQHSPQPDTLFDEPSILDSFPLWTAPTPPHSDSGLPPPLSLDAHDSLITTSGIDLSNHFTFDQPTTDMSSSLGFLLPSAYGSGGDDDDYSNDSSYQIPPVRLSQSTTSSGTAAYAQAGSSSPSHYASRPNASASRSAPTIPPMNHSPLPSPHPGGPSYSSTSAAARSLFDSNMHPPHSSHYAASYHAGQQPPSQYSPSNPSDILHKPSSSEANARAMSARPKPQCWEHGCNGRQFSTFSNLLRHQREKSGTSSKSSCPKCGAEFTRTTARNGHLAHDKCTKTPRPGDEDK